MVGRRWDLDYPPPWLESAPSWTKGIPPSPTPLVISSIYDQKGLSYNDVLDMYDDVAKPNAHFIKRQFIVEKDFMQFV